MKKDKHGRVIYTEGVMAYTAKRNKLVLYVDRGDGESDEVHIERGDLKRLIDAAVDVLTNKKATR